MVAELLVEVLLVGELHSQTTNNYFHLSKRSTQGEGFGSDFEECQLLMSDFRSFILPTIRALASQEWVARRIILTTMIPRHTILMEEPIANGEGFQAGDSLPSHVAGLLSLRTGRGGRSAHGRLYFAGIAEDTSSGSRLESSSLGQLAAIGDTLVSRYGPSGTNDKFEYGVYSRKLGDTDEDGPPPFKLHHMVGFIPIISTVPRVELKSMRRRMLHRGQ